jgi:hypothetical protein
MPWIQEPATLYPVALPRTEPFRTVPSVINLSCTIVVAVRSGRDRLVRLDHPEEASRRLEGGELALRAQAVNQILVKESRREDRDAETRRFVYSLTGATRCLRPT